MSIMNFDPARYIMLDWLSLVRMAFPVVPLNSERNGLLEAKILFSRLKTQVDGDFQLQVSLNKAAMRETDKVVIKPFKVNAFKLPWLLPSGALINPPVFNGNAGLVRIVNHFVFDGKKFFETDDGSFICGTPEVDDRLIKLYWPKVEEKVIPALPKLDIEYFDENATVI